MKLSKNQNYLFHKGDGTKFSTGYISKRFKKYVLKAGLDEKYHFHCLRHSSLTFLANMGVSSFMIKEIAGHKNIKTTESYVRPSHEETKRVLNEIKFPWRK